MSEGKSPLGPIIGGFLTVFVLIVAYGIGTGDETAKKIIGYAPQLFIGLIFLVLIVVIIQAALETK